MRAPQMSQEGQLQARQKDPTSEAYAALQKAFEHYNRTLFEGRLPYCLITMQREQKYAGYFSAQRFVNRDDKRMTDEIAINPAYFAVVPLLSVLETLVHEMVHAWQFHFGKPSRRAYHNKEWGSKMEALGLMPTSTGRPGGKRTGQKVSHFSIAGGRFLQATEELLATDFTIAWLDRYPAPRPLYQQPLTMEQIQAAIARQGLEGPRDGGEPEESDAVDTESAEEGSDGSDHDEALEELLVDQAGTKANKTNRLKFRCPSCSAQAWGKPSLKLICGEDDCNQAVFKEAA